MVNQIENVTYELENVKTLYDGVRGFKHDFDNIMTTIGGYINLNDMNGLKRYYLGLLSDCSNLRNLQFISPDVINEPGIYNLIASKYQKALECNVKMDFESFFDFSKLNMPIYEFSRILGILLDNAIEAASVCNDGQVNLIFRASPKVGVQYVTIENNFCQDDIDIHKIFVKGVSGKKAHSGLGLWEVKKIIEKFDNVSLDTSKDETYFKQELSIGDRHFSK